MEKTRIFFDGSGGGQVRHLQNHGVANVRAVQDLFTCEELARIIHDEKVDYALCCHASVSLPYDICNIVTELIADMEVRFGSLGWGMCANAGVEAISLRSIRYRFDIRHSILPSPSSPLRPAVGLDPHLLLLHVAAFRRLKILPPRERRWDNIAHVTLLSQCWAGGLACVLDSRLYAHHDFFPSTSRGILHQARAYFTGYEAEEISMDRFGVISLGKEADHQGFHRHVLSTMRAVGRRHPRKSIHVVTRTRLERPWYLRRLLNSLRAVRKQGLTDCQMNIVLSVNNVPQQIDRKAVLCEILDEFAQMNPIVVDGDAGPFKMFPRVRSIAAALDVLPAGPTDHVWIVDDDDFILPDSIPFLDTMLLMQGVIVGNSLVYREKWKNITGRHVISDSSLQSRYDGARYFEILNGYNFVPVCSVIFPSVTLKSVFEKYDLRGDYYEDYMLLVASMLSAPSRHFPVALAGISMHGDNTVLERNKTRWNHSYATFMAELARLGPLPNCCHEYLSAVNFWMQDRRLIKDVLARLPMADRLARIARKVLDRISFR